MIDSPSLTASSLALVRPITMVRHIKRMTHDPAGDMQRILEGYNQPTEQAEQGIQKVSAACTICNSMGLPKHISNISITHVNQKLNEEL